MATALLEREKINVASGRQVADEAHNARIRDNYAKLINPDVKIEELLQRGENDNVVVASAVAVEPAVESVNVAGPQIEQRPYWVENARADSIIFRADSAINRRSAVVAEAETEEEENEDLRPTSTTIQYKTTGVKNTVEESKIETSNAEKRKSLSKKERIVIAVVVTLIVALFALIIINSAIISNLNADINSLQSSLTTVKGAYAGISDQVNDFTANIADIIEDFARANGMVKLG